VSLTERLAQSLQGSIHAGQLWVALAAAFVGGLLTAFTPCVYPLIAITIRYFGGGQRRGGRRRAVVHAGFYVAGMTLLYAVLGTVTAASKSVFGTMLASPLVTGAVALLCAAMGSSLLGAFTLQLPSVLSTRLSRIGGQSYGGAFAMGLVSGLIAAPCTGPVLAVILTLIAATGGVGVGASLMVFFSLGLGLPFLALAVFSNMLTRLPRGGPWMELVKLALATPMFVFAIYFGRLAWPPLGRAVAAVPHAGLAAVVLLAMGCLLVMLALQFLEHRRALLGKAAAVACLSLALVLVGFGGGGARGRGDDVVWEAGHDAAVSRAKAEHRPVMIDFTADWCTACKELERTAYVAPAVLAEAARFIAVKVDATNLDEATQALFDRYHVLGLPALVFVDSRGDVLASPRVSGLVTPERLVELMQQVH
jgi:thioredoxin:protein disulfide reductase